MDNIDTADDGTLRAGVRILIQGLIDQHDALVRELARVQEANRQTAEWSRPATVDALVSMTSEVRILAAIAHGALVGVDDCTNGVEYILHLARYIADPEATERARHDFEEDVREIIRQDFEEDMRREARWPLDGDTSLECPDDCDCPRCAGEALPPTNDREELMSVRPEMARFLR